MANLFAYLKIKKTHPLNMKTIIIGDHLVRNLRTCLFPGNVHIESFPGYKYSDIQKDPLILPISLADDSYDACVFVLNASTEDAAEMYSIVGDLLQVCTVFGIFTVLFTEIPGNPELNRRLRDSFKVSLIKTHISEDKKRYTWEKGTDALSIHGCVLIAANVQLALNASRLSG